MLSELTAPAQRLALVGLAKNTGKTEALAALLRELARLGRRVGVTSVGRDGEEHDVIDFRIDKPRVHLPAQSLLASTDSLLAASGIPFELLQDTGFRTPLGRVLIARLKGAGAVEVAGPSAADQVRHVSDAMLAHGAEQVLIDGAIDRRAASRPDVADGLLMSTGAVLAEDIGEVVRLTRTAVELVRLPRIDPDSPPARWLDSGAAHDQSHGGVLMADDGSVVELAPRFVLSAGGRELRELWASSPQGRWLLVPGALPDSFLRELPGSLRPGGRELTIVVADPTRVFLAGRELGWYAAQGIEIRAVRETPLLALTVNPVAPQSHTFDSARLRELLEAEIPGLPMFDVLDPAYRRAA